jgi:hypothetical protein
MNVKLIVVAAALVLGGTALADDGKTSGVIPGLLFGPKLVLVSVPTPGVGLEVKQAGAGLFGASVDFGYLPLIAVGGQGKAKIGFTNLSATARVLPSRGSIFLGAAVGSRKFTAKATDSATGEAAKADVTSAYVAPELGWRWVWESGFYMATDLGWQIVLSHKSTFDLPASANAQDVKDVQDAADKVGKVGLPILGLVQLGWFS